MRSMFSISGVIFVSWLFFCVDIPAQDRNDNFVFQDAKLLKLSMPEYPKEAKVTGLTGRVSVLVSIDEKGKVTSVNDAIGPGWICPSVMTLDVIALRNSALQAALKSKFSPALKDGKPVNSTTRLNFDFVGTEAKQKDKKFNTSALDYNGPVGNGNYSEAPIPNKAEVVKAEPIDNKTKYTTKGDYSSAELSNPVDKSATTKLVGTPSTLSGGILNGKAMKLPRPKYPAAARAVGASGAVSVQVLIDTEGNVFSAAPVSGHPLLRSASRLAACESKFRPTQLSGLPVKVKGIITYNFVP